jgi:hypothetical protein
MDKLDLDEALLDNKTLPSMVLQRVTSQLRR